MEYRVELDVYNGPMDLLLYLIKRDELDITDIPISHITRSYLDYVKMLQSLDGDEGLDINVAGEFLVMAATLMEIKSALLLPRLIESTDSSAPSMTAEDLTDPRYELVQKLLEYKRFKDSATLLERKALTHSKRFPRYPVQVDTATPGDEPPPLDMEEVQIWDLLDAFNRLMHEVGLRKNFHDVTYDDTPIDLYVADIEDRLARDGRLTLRQLIMERKTKSEMIGVFLALLELTRQKKVLVSQIDAADDIEILPAPEEHRRTYHENMSADQVDADEEPAKAPDDADADDAGERGNEASGSLLDDVGADTQPDDDV